MKFLQLSSKQIFLGITFVVAFCSIVYELIFAHLLNIVFGATVVQYSLVIGFFMFALGVGSFAVEYLAKDKTPDEQKVLFIMVEVSITITAILGAVLILFLSAFVSQNEFINIFLEVIGFIPVVLVGFLSGAELPLLVYMYNKDAFTQVLGTDYFGSLLGTILYSLVILPALGIVSTTVFIASINLFLALLFAIFVYRKHRTAYTAALFIALFVASFYFASSREFNKYIESLYLSKTIENVYAEYGIKNTQVYITDILTTPYQQAIEYDIVFEAGSDFANKDHCLNLDRHLQACGNWTESYHHGLVDVPMSVINKDKLDILVLGGGDFIPSNFLRRFDDRINSIDVVDIDAQFQEFAKKSKFLQKYNQGAYNYPKMHIHVADAFKYLRTNTKKYDLILFDLPGIKHDKLLPLYSKEMFSFIFNSLKDDGIFVSWFYPKEMFPKHAKVIENTLMSAGFKNRLDYVAYNKYKDSVQETEQFFILPKNQNMQLKINTRANTYTQNFKDKYAHLKMYTMQAHPNVAVNSVLYPNTDIIVFKPLVAKLKAYDTQ